MMHAGGGPPDKWAVISTRNMTDPTQLADFLSESYADGYEGPVITVPDPTTTGSTWVAVAGYKK
jgi:hypothetical protein